MAPRTRTKSVFWLSVISTMSKSSPVKEILIFGKKKKTRCFVFRFVCCVIEFDVVVLVVFFVVCEF